MRAMLGGLVALLLVTGCARPHPATHEAASRSLLAACSGWNPSVQTAIVEAVVMGGGPGAVSVVGWTCGEATSGVVRIVFLGYRALGDEVPAAVVPVVFENGYALAFGWGLFERQPDRYGEQMDVRAWGPPDWGAPSGWVVHKAPPQPPPESLQ